MTVGGYAIRGKMVLSKIFKNKSVKFLTKFFFNLEKKLGVEDRKKGLEKQKS